MIAVDTNILVYAHRADARLHDFARESMRQLAEGTAPWAVPWPCFVEFFVVVTHPLIYKPPTNSEAALDQIDKWARSPSLNILGAGPGFWDDLRRTIRDSRVIGPQAYDAQIAALCLHHRVRELWTADRDFGRFPELAVKNPLVA